MKQKIIILLFLVLLASPLTLQAQQEGNQEPCSAQGLEDTDGDGKCEISNPAPGILVRFGNFGSLLVHGIRLMLLFAGGVAVLFFMIGAFQYIAARGNEEEAEKAKKSMTSALVGVVLIIMAFSIVTIVNTLITRAPTVQDQTDTE